MAELTQFDIGSAARIGRTVRIVEDMHPPAKPLVFGPVMQSSRRGGVRMATFPGAWAKNATKTVTLKYQTTTPNTYSAMNIFVDIGTSLSATRNCAIARDGTAWFLIAAEC